MEILKREYKLCPSCMEMHEVLTVLVQEENIFKEKAVHYTAIYGYCEKTEEYYASEDMMTKNDVAMKNA